MGRSPARVAEHVHMFNHMYNPPPAPKKPLLSPPGEARNPADASEMVAMTAGRN